MIVHGADDQVEVGERRLRCVEAAVFQDVHFQPDQHRESLSLFPEAAKLLDVLFQPRNASTLAR